MNTPAEPLGTLEVALRHGARLLERDPAAAAEQAAEILKVQPDQADALQLSGLALGRLGKGEEAIAALRRAVHFKPALHEAWRALADHYSALEMREAADEAFAQQLRHSTRDPQLMAAALALLENRIPDAEEILRARLQEHDRLRAQLVTAIGLSAYMSWRADGSCRTDERWRIPELMRLLFSELPNEARVEFARISQVKSIQKDIGQKLTMTVAAVCSGMLAARSIPMPPVR